MKSCMMKGGGRKEHVPSFSLEETRQRASMAKAVAAKLHGVGKAFSEPGGQSGVHNLGLGLGEIVGETAQLDSVGAGIVDDVGGTPVAVAGLADAADVDEIFLLRL